MWRFKDLHPGEKFFISFDPCVKVDALTYRVLSTGRRYHISPFTTILPDPILIGK